MMARSRSPSGRDIRRVQERPRLSERQPVSHQPAISDKPAQSTSASSEKRMQVNRSGRCVS